jgi:hypothetical protein
MSRPPSEEATAVLRHLLRDGPRTRAEIIEAAHNAGIAEADMRKAISVGAEKRWVRGANGPSYTSKSTPFSAELPLDSTP